MSFFENTRKPQGFGGKLMTKMMNRGHAKLSQWGFSNISAKSDAEVLEIFENPQVITMGILKYLREV